MLIDDLLPALARAVFSIALLILVLAAASRGVRESVLAPEQARKVVHVSLGVYCLTFPFLFDGAAEVAAVCSAAAAVFAFARSPAGAWLGRALHAVQRPSLGEVWFALAIGLLFALMELASARMEFAAPWLLYCLPVAILAFSDAAAALVGSRFGRARFRVGNGVKSLEGSAAFAVTAFLLGLAALSAEPEVDLHIAVTTSLALAVIGAMLEAASNGGLDNLLVPLGSACVLGVALDGDPAFATGLSLTAAAALGALANAGWLAAPALGPRLGGAGA